MTENPHPEYYQAEISRALGLALRVLVVPVARALVLVSISPRWHALALLTANTAVLQAPVLHSCL